MRACCWCIHYNPISWLCRVSERNVSGRKCWYRRYSKHRCMLKQEDRYPKNCDYEKNIEYQRELDEKFPDLKQLKDKLNEIWIKLAKQHPELGWSIGENEKKNKKV